jgi:predicted nucleic acid-binding Zn ribbon protein
MSTHRRNRKSFAPIGSVINELMRQYRPANDKQLLQVWEVWDQAVGAPIAANARPVAFKGDTLLIHVGSSTWLHHIRFLENELIEKLNAALGHRCVRSVKLKVGAL